MTQCVWPFGGNGVVGTHTAVLLGVDRALWICNVRDCLLSIRSSRYDVAWKGPWDWES
jgi:hypothetical protein